MMFCVAMRFVSCVSSGMFSGSSNVIVIRNFIEKINIFARIIRVVNQLLLYRSRERFRAWVGESGSWPVSAFLPLEVGF